MSGRDRAEKAPTALGVVTRAGPRDMEILRVPIDSLHPDPDNPRSHDDRNVALIASSLHDHGQAEPLVVQAGTRRVIGGHGRIEAMRQLGWEECNVVELDLNDLQARALAIRLNRTAETAGWASGLAEALEALEADGYDPATLGFSPGEVDALFAGAETVGGAPAPAPVPLKTLDAKPMPKMAWVLVGIPVRRYGEIDRQVRALAAVPGILCETAISMRDGGGGA
jgi:ParB-like chromosome segregation protein Spo0J